MIQELKEDHLDFLHLFTLGLFLVLLIHFDFYLLKKLLSIFIF